MVVSPALFVRALCLRAALPALLWALPLDRVLAVLTRRAGRRRGARAPLSAIEQVTDLLTRHVPLSRTHCLQRALLRYALLAEHAHAPVFVIGVRAGGAEGFEAHAWVEVGGRPVMERDPQRCARTYAYPAPLALG